MGYFTTSKLQYAPKTGQHFSQTQRKEKANINSKTNFIADTGDGAYESPPKRFEYGKQPEKEACDKTGIKALIEDLKAAHFNVGKQSMAPIRTNQAYGTGVLSAKKPEKSPWAHMETSFALGGDRPNLASDYTTRFAQSAKRSQSIGLSPGDEAKRNKARITSDNTVISENRRNHGFVSSHAQFPDKFAASRNINKPLDPAVNNSLRTSHFRTGYGAFGGQSEQKGKYVSLTRSQVNSNRLSPERISFFKDAHFSTGSANMGFSGMCMSKSTYVEHDVKNRPNINANNNAFNLRHHIHDHGKIGVQASGYVT